MANLWMLWIFFIIVAIFHLSEFFLVWCFHRDNLSWDSMLFSWPYVAMLILALGEYWVESHYFPILKHPFVSALGIALCISGELIRKSAMVTAGRGFTHEIAEYRHPKHELITHGIYRFSCHPGYFGWFWWAIGAQLVLSNPLSTIVTAIAAWRFFAERIPYEEERLQQFFGEAYATYRLSTPTRLPFIP
jgi:protein-S-isoprenylcysteine O-methyltransferase